VNVRNFACSCCCLAKVVKFERYSQSALSSLSGQLGVKSLQSLSSESNGSLLLKATSIHGDGDKIALPPSVLDTLSQLLSDDVGPSSQQQPWTFRIGLLNPNYAFPASPELQNLPLVHENEEMDDGNDDGDSDDFSSAYLEELRYKYLAYTHATVVEFTQEEGYIGIPRPIANVLLHSKHGTGTVESFRTVDPSKSSIDDNDMTVEGNQEESTTPGHLAWGAFDLPAPLLEISMVRLPLGRTAALQPTVAAIQAGFYQLNNVKLVLEQSLIRTRATLSVGDVISTWHRGAQFDLTVTKVTPATFHAVSCINTDIEIDFEVPPAENSDASNDSAAPTGTMESQLVEQRTQGRRLNDAPSPLLPAARPLVEDTAASLTLLSEPPIEQKDGVVTVQIRGGGIMSRELRRFDVSRATVRDLFAFASSIARASDSTTKLDSYQLVTRFPRRVLTLHESSKTLSDVGLSAGQELFLIEPWSAA
jgi:Ubiquitin fusion degradation protein UFD1/UBX domain